jgi:YjjG family noncanonical pyrimidine nucleotidase
MATPFAMLPPFILFDLDDTLFDHTHASRAALAQLHDSHLRDTPFEAFVHEHARLLEIHHHRFLRGELSMDEARAARMQALFAAYEQNLSAQQALSIAHQYRREHQNNRRLVDGARELLDALFEKSRLGIVTNSSVTEQMEKLRTLDIGRYFDTLVMSEDVGVAKPDTRIFEIALERIGAKPHETVMIGDSYTNDVMGATDAGIAAIWFNRFRHETSISTAIDSQKTLKMPVDIGVSQKNIASISAFAPLKAALAAIAEAFQQHSPQTKTKESNNAKLATLAP